MDDRLVELEYTDKKEARLDHFLVEELPEFTRTRLQGLIAKEMVTVNGKIAKKKRLEALTRHAHYSSYSRHSKN